MLHQNLLKHFILSIRLKAFISQCTTNFYILPPRVNVRVCGSSSASISGSEEQICHWSSWGGALPWQTGLCLWNESRMENVTQYWARLAAFHQNTLTWARLENRHRTHPVEEAKFSLLAVQHASRVSFLQFKLGCFWKVVVGFRAHPLNAE